MQHRSSRGRTYGIMLSGFVLLAAVVALLGGPVGAPGSAAAPLASESPAHTATPSQTPTETPTPDQSRGSLDVFAYFDINLNGKPEQGETPLGGAGFRISLDETPVATGVTASDGHALFTNLVPGVYRVDETTPPAGYTPNRSSSYAAVVGGMKSTLPFSYRMSTQTPQPTATPTATAAAQVRHVWLPLLVR